MDQQIFTKIKMVTTNLNSIPFSALIQLKLAPYHYHHLKKSICILWSVTLTFVDKTLITVPDYTKTTTTTTSASQTKETQ